MTDLAAWVTDAHLPIVTAGREAILVPDWAGDWAGAAIAVPAPGPAALIVPAGGEMTEIFRMAKAPADSLRIVLDWREYLAAQGWEADAITALAVTGGGLTVAASHETGGFTTAWVAGGTAGAVYRVTFGITLPSLTGAGTVAVERAVRVSVREP